MKKILVAVPAFRFIEVDTFKSIYDLEIPYGYTVDFVPFLGNQIDQIRNEISNCVIKDYDYLFSVDSDIVFAPDTLARLLAHNVDIVSGLYIQRKPGQHILEVYKHNQHGGVTNIPYEEIVGQGLIKIASCGFGCALVKSAVIKSIPYPYFKYHSAINHNNTISEDVDFCRKALHAGFKIWADTTIHCKHIGSAEFVINTEITPVNKEVDTQNKLRQLSYQNNIPQSHFEYLKNFKNAYPNFTPTVIYDIGSCVMHWTNMAMQLWPNATYILFDGSKSVEFLYKEKGIQNYHIGVLSNESGKEVDFWQTENQTHLTGNSYYKENADIVRELSYTPIEQQPNKVVTSTLSDVVTQKNFPLPDLVKIDVQGAELDIIKGAIPVIQHAQHVILELQVVNYNLGAPLRDEVIEFMDQIGFDLVLFFCDNGPDGDYHFARRQ